MCVYVGGGGGGEGVPPCPGSFVKAETHCAMRQLSMAFNGLKMYI